ncbi:hypothetical protein EMIHUDRAFT_226728 [Emiliania huxleyi CCMP1516]|uniref:Sulfotransferase domain-containing protein n=2 Tax=Emiliania huxleyi TaxID=2903 RepID=A0A0D3KK68_EMIH1|nr:hypothetical protein EMIHUDRAFT_226728 [Emiliania huxleyi CCMP1516]EOD36153.1 hypothetical protein EMIHUDRAFT_226728 [Emiliania huxleyi CCMP1516]|eukprot:XP_005788582.1 hypothetical protein EMIHUDRAFT_226728 [Emiliania huxleyi CCMP1516]
MHDGLKGMRGQRTAVSHPKAASECELVQQTSTAQCQLGISYGCRKDELWVSGCRGFFRCQTGGPLIPCGYPPGAREYNCSCASPPHLCPPAFYIAGAQKSGTSSLASWLNRLPSAAVDPREAAFSFTWALALNESCIDLDASGAAGSPAWLHSHCAKLQRMVASAAAGGSAKVQRMVASAVVDRHRLHSAEACRGGKSIGIKWPSYMGEDAWAPRSIHACGGAPVPRVIFVLREPAARAASHFRYFEQQRHWWRPRGWKPLVGLPMAMAFREVAHRSMARVREIMAGEDAVPALASEESFLNMSYSSRGAAIDSLYAYQLREWLRAFGGCGAFLIGIYEAHCGVLENHCGSVRNASEQGESAAVFSATLAQLREFFAPFNRLLEKELMGVCRLVPLGSPPPQGLGGVLAPPAAFPPVWFDFSAAGSGRHL